MFDKITLSIQSGRACQGAEIPALGVILCCFCEDSAAHHGKARA